MSKNSKIGLEGLLRPEDSILVLIESALSIHQFEQL